MGNGDHFFKENFLIIILSIMENKIDYNSLFLGLIIGASLVLGVMWYTNRNSTKNDDWWCSYLSSKENEYCHNLYSKFQSIIDKIGKDDQPCIPDYIGGCN